MSFLEVKNKLYDIILLNMELNDEVLNNFGLTSSDIDKLKKGGLIFKSNNGYDFKDLNGLFSYGKNLLKNKDYKKANKCFNKCYELKPNNLNYCLQVFFNSIKEKNYTLTFEIYSKLLNSNKNILRDLKYYIYLLSLITEVPDKYKEFVKNLKYEDIKILENNTYYDNIDARNKIRYDVMGKKINKSIQQLNLLISSKSKVNFNDLIVLELLKQAKEKERKYMDKLVSLINARDYKKVINYLEERRKTNKLIKIEIYMLNLAKKIMWIKNTGTIIEPRNRKKQKSIYSYIDNENYIEAEKMSLSINKNGNLNVNNNAIYLLLNHLNELISDLNKINMELMPIFTCFLNNEAKKGLLNINKYLKSIDKMLYKNLIIDLIKISLIEHDYNFTRVISEIYEMRNLDYKFNVDKYINNFYESIYRNKITVAEKYLNIIIEYSNKLNLNIDIIKLNKIYEDKKKTGKDNIKTDIETSKRIDDINKNGSKEIISTSSDICKMDELHDKVLESKDIIMIKDLDRETIVKALKIAKNYRDVRLFTIDYGESKNLIIIEKKEEEKPNEYNEVYERARTNYCKKRYKEGIQDYIDVIKFAKKIYAYTFGRIGIMYLNLNEYDKALDYFIMANGISKKLNQGLNYDELIKTVSELKKGKIDIKSKKTNQFDDTNNYFGIKNFKNINRMIESTCFDVETACKYFNMSKEETNLVKLLYAREYYYQKDYKTGDKFLNDVINSKEKTGKVINALNKIMTNRNFFYNRNPHKDKILDLIIEPHL